MNWKRGLLRVWIALSAIWVGFIGLARWDDVARITTAPKIDKRGTEISEKRSILVTGLDGSVFSFPAGSLEMEVSAALKDHYDGKRLLKPLKPVTDPEILRALNTGITNGERWDLATDLIFRAVGPPIMVLIAAWVLAWVARGFRDRTAIRQRDPSEVTPRI